MRPFIKNTVNEIKFTYVAQEYKEINTPKITKKKKNKIAKKKQEKKSWNLEGVVLEPSFIRLIHTDSVSKILGKVDPDENGIEGLDLLNM